MIKWPRDKVSVIKCPVIKWPVIKCPSSEDFSLQVKLERFFCGISTTVPERKNGLCRSTKIITGKITRLEKEPWEYDWKLLDFSLPNSFSLKNGEQNQDGNED